MSYQARVPCEGVGDRGSNRVEIETRNARELNGSGIEKPGTIRFRAFLVRQTGFEPATC